MAPDLVACLRQFNGLRAASLRDCTDVQTQLHMGKNKVHGDVTFAALVYMYKTHLFVFA